MKQNFKPTTSRSGFSLVEVLVVVAIAAAIVITVGNFSGNINLLNNLVSVQVQSKSDVGQTLQIMESEIRDAVPSQNGAYPIDSATTGTFAFYSDLDKDGSVEHVRYFLASSSIKRGLIQPTGTPATYPTSSEVIASVADNVALVSSTPLFSYYGASYTGTQSSLVSPVDVSQIRLIGINFMVAVRASSSPTSTQYFSAMVDMRNLRSN